MITSLKFMGMHNVGMSSNHYINVGDTKVSKKDIPFIRYDLISYGESEIKFIEETMQKFDLSTHLVQIRLNSMTQASVENIEKFKATGKKFATYLYVDVVQEEYLTRDIGSKIDWINWVVKATKIDRVMLVDRTDSMDMAGAKKIIEKISKTVGIKITDIGICDSPLCMSGEMACLTALKARELATVYGEAVDVALPSANHQCMNQCGCMRYFEINADIPAPAERVSKASKSVKEPKEKKVKAESKSTKSNKHTYYNDFSMYV